MFQDKTKANVGFKLALGLAHTSNSRESYNESIASGLISAASNIWAQAIKPTPADALNTGIVSALVTLALEAVSGVSTSYVAKLGGTVPASLVGKTNPQTAAPYAAGDRVGWIIPQSFGAAYRPVLKKAGTEVTPLDAADWFIDCFAGVITQESDGDSPLLALGATGTLEAYIYIGKTLVDSLSEAGRLHLNLSAWQIDAGEVPVAETNGQYDVESFLPGVDTAVYATANLGVNYRPAKPIVFSLTFAAAPSDPTHSFRVELGYQVAGATFSNTPVYTAIAQSVAQPGDDNFHTVTFTIPPQGSADVAATFDLRLSRLGSDVLDNHAGNLQVLSTTLYQE